MIDELTSYLDREADRVNVRDTLAEIESGLASVAVTQPRRRSGWMAGALVGGAAALVVVIGVAMSGNGARSDVGDGSGVAPSPVTPDDGNAEPPPETPTTAPAVSLVPIPLPDGGTMQGFTPSCTTRDGIEFDCIVEGYRNAGGYADGGIDHTGEVQAIISAASVVMGGCRSTSADGSTWHCAIGERSIALAMIGPDFLGDWAPIGYAAG